MTNSDNFARDFNRWISVKQSNSSEAAAANIPAALVALAKEIVSEFVAAHDFASNSARDVSNELNHYMRTNYGLLSCDASGALFESIISAA